jgi:hypothetical protein
VEYIKKSIVVFVLAIVLLAGCGAVSQDTFPAGWEGKLEPGSYRLTWGAADYGSITAEFPIVANEWTFLHINQGVQSAQTR